MVDIISAADVYVVCFGIHSSELCMLMLTDAKFMM